MKKLMTGNEAFALGAYLSGAKVGTGYPGTPSTEILINFARYPGVYAEWSPNEKVALDVGVGAAYSGSRVIVTTKHVGLNVAADSLFYASYTGLKGGLVIINADDPEMHSSQNEQDNRYYAKFSKVPMLEPADSQEALQFIGTAFEISEAFDTPVIVRTNTRLSHSKSVVEVSGEDGSKADPEEVSTRDEAWYERNIPKYVMVPGFARRRHPVVIQRLEKLADYAETNPINQILPGNGKLGVITAGVAYQYAREVFPDANYLKLGMVYPLPVDLVKKLADQVERVVVVEELEPFIEEHVRLLGIPVSGKEVFPRCGEFSPEKVRGSAAKAGLVEVSSPDGSVGITAQLPARPPMLCPGCAHRGIFYALQRVRAVVFGDIGCYTLGALPPLSAMHTCGCMGAGVGVVHGVDKVGVKDRTVAVIGDSTFFHSGIPPAINVIYNRGISTIIILDNRVTAMTGHQENPGSGRTLQKEGVKQVNIERLLRGIGFDKVDVVNPYDFAEVLRVLKDHLDADEPSAIVARYPCVLFTRERKPSCTVDLEACNQCGNCLRIGCSPISKVADGVSIDPALCNGCGFCAEICPRKAINASGGNAN
ncbi:indolepyruvate ferredoxin oxidoreductase [Clostridiales bacterium PH28_bin88]|nr:indolepyruvate ferredoxin oxidoreductase [Clostridiales bacterium PH28_bin88]